MATLTIPISRPEFKKPHNCGLSIVYRPVVFTFKKIREAHEYIASCSTISKVALTILAGVVIAAVSLPPKMIFLIITEKCLSSVVGKEKYNAISNRNPMYGGTPLSGFSNCILDPLLEEVVFRGIIQPSIKTCVNFIATPFFKEATAKKIAVIAAIVFTSLLFGAAHFGNSSNLLVSLPQVIATSFAGIIYGLEKEFGGGLLETTAHHMTNNTIVWGLIQMMKPGR